MVDDARYRTKVWLDTYLSNANLTKDDDSTQVTFITAFGYPDYPLLRVFIDKAVDLVYSVGKPVSTPMMDPLTQSPYGYNEKVPIEITCITKQGVTGLKLLWKAEAELRRIAETNPEGSVRNLSDSTDITQMMSTIIHGVRVEMTYRRDTT